MATSDESTQTVEAGHVSLFDAYEEFQSQLEKKEIYKDDDLLLQFISKYHDGVRTEIYQVERGEVVKIDIKPNEVYHYVSFPLASYQRLRLLSTEDFFTPSEFFLQAYGETVAEATFSMMQLFKRTVFQVPKTMQIKVFVRKSPTVERVEGWVTQTNFSSRYFAEMIIAVVACEQDILPKSPHSLQQSRSRSKRPLK